MTTRTVRVQFPPGVTEYRNADNLPLYADTDGTANVDVSKFDLPAMLRLGVALVPHGTGTTAQRPAANACYPGMPFFDSSLGLPIWRNATNAGWINAAGAAV
jgi:hypothetical protein